MKSYYSCLDTLLTTPQAEQHFWIKEMAKIKNGKVVFYGAEEYFMMNSQPFILKKLQRTPNLNGVIFFTLDQFCYGNEFNASLMMKIIKNNFSIHFARENVSIINNFEFEKQYLELLSYFHCKKNQTNILS